MRRRCEAKRRQRSGEEPGLFRGGEGNISTLLLKSKCAEVEALPYFALCSITNIPYIHLNFATIDAGC